MDDYPLVSIIMTTRNEEINVKNCLESIRNQTYSQDKSEIIVVGNNTLPIRPKR